MKTLYSLIAVAVMAIVSTVAEAAPGGATKWYFIQFANANNLVVASNGAGANCVSATKDLTANAQQWKIEGDQTNGYTITNKLGLSLTFTGTTEGANIQAASNPTENNKFFINQNGTNFTISPQGASGQGINCWGGFSAGNAIRLYSASDRGDQLQIATSGGASFQFPAVLRLDSASAAHGYVEIDSVPGKSGINIPGEVRGSDGLPQHVRKLTSWTNAQAHAVYYFYHDNIQLRTYMRYTVRRGATVKLHFTQIDPDSNIKLVDDTITLVGTGSPDTITIANAKYNEAKYYRYDFECVQGNTYITNIDEFYFEGSSSNEHIGWVANYLSSPSVHLSSWHSTESMPRGDVNDYAYMEVMIPTSSDIVGTYCMSLGVIRGYMGIQNDGGSDAQGRPTHDIIFSQWDDGDRQNDPDLPDNLKAATIDYIDDPYANPYTFGGEGTGAGFRLNGYQWYPDKWVKFLCNARRDTSYYYSYTRDTTIVNGKQVITKTDSTRIMQQNLLVTAWFNVSDGKGWKYLATTRVANAGGGLIGSWYSFMENYSHPSGSWERKAYYGKAFVHNPTTNRWYSMNSVGFGNTDGGSGVGARNDFGRGRSHEEGFEDYFYMRSGSYKARQESENTIPIATDFTCVDTINLTALSARVQQAVDKEILQNRLDSIVNRVSSLKKSGWRVVQFSDQSATGEGTNGRAQQIVDGDDNTYWHSQWTPSRAAYPHTITVDMQSQQDVSGFNILMSNGGGTRTIKSYEIYGTNDASLATATGEDGWDMIFKDSLSPNQTRISAILDESASIRYFRIKILDGYASEGPFVRINEVSLLSMSKEDQDLYKATKAALDELKLKTKQNDSPTGIASAQQAHYSKGQLTVSGNTVTLQPNGDEVGKASLKVYTLQGVVLHKIDMEPQNDVYVATLPQLENGTYILVAGYDKGVAALKYRVR